MSGDRAGENRLGGESSPYLRLHRGNPVDWYPWGEEALAAARRLDRPIFLSVGYSTCHWCHVMERESFSDREVAELMNREFVNIKVDREERPELDEIYMAATQILTRHGGWPNSVFLTPELKPFYAGTYFPPEDRHGLPSFRRVLDSLAEAWKTRRGDIEEQAESLTEAVRRYLEERAAPGPAPPGPEVASRSLAALEARFDPLWGGFGGAPKFPTPSNLFLLEALAEESPRAAEMLDATLDRMARGGLYDQLGGGFHRYATDREWKVPHFEKMLYDNGLLLEIYARRWARTGDPEMARVAAGTAAFLARELTSPEGALWSALDAETGGEEGAYYVWRREELREALGEEDFGFLAPILGFSGAPFFEGDRYVLHLPEPLAEQAERRRMAREELAREVAAHASRLLAVRDRREPLAVDDKVLADWNGMAICGLATAGALLPDPLLVERAARAAEFVLSELRGEDGVLVHAWRGGLGRAAAFLSDYVYLVRGLLALERASGQGRWLEAAEALAAEQVERLGDADGGFFAAAAAPDVLFRTKEVFDGAVPGANAVAALNFLELARRTGERRWRREAERTLAAFAPLVERVPDGARMLALAAWRFAAEEGEAGPAAAAPRSEAAAPPPAPADGERPVAIEITLGDPDGDGWRALAVRLVVADGWHLYAPGAPNGLGLAGVGVALADLAFPDARPAPLGPSGEEVPVYAGEIEIGARARPEAPTGARLLLTYQACTKDRCLAPSTLEAALE